MNTQRTSAVALASSLMLAGWAAAEPLAVLECREIVGRDWPRTLVTYQREFAAGWPGRTICTCWTVPAKSSPFSSGVLKMHEDGSLASARISFYAELAQGWATIGIPGGAGGDTGKALSFEAVRFAK